MSRLKNWEDRESWQEFKYIPAVGTFKSWLLHTTRWKIAAQFRKRLPAAEPACPSAAPTTSTSPIERALIRRLGSTHTRSFGTSV
jgi:hypothetical protein